MLMLQVFKTYCWQKGIAQIPRLAVVVLASRKSVGEHYDGAHSAVLLSCICDQSFAAGGERQIVSEVLCPAVNFQGL